MWTHKMGLVRRKRRKHCTAVEEHGISAHEDTSAIFFLGKKGSTLPDAPYLGKLKHYNFHKTQKGRRESLLSTLWDLVKDELLSSKGLDMPFFSLGYKTILNTVGRKQLFHPVL